jgi:hypothetical protein
MPPEVLAMYLGKQGSRQVAPDAYREFFLAAMQQSLDVKFAFHRPVP